MEKLLKVLLSVDNNNYKITIKTKTFTNSVPFADFKHFVDEKHKLLFSDRSYVWKVYDNDFGEYVALDDNTPIYDLSKIIAVTSTNAGNRNDRNENVNRASFESNRQMIDYNHERTRPAEVQMQMQMQTPQRQLRQSSEIDLRDFVSAYRSPAVDTMQDRGAPNSFKTYYPSNQGTPNIARDLPMSSLISAGYSNYSPQTSGVMPGYDFQSTPRVRNPYLNPNPQSQRRDLSPPSYYTNLPPTFNERYKPYDNYNRNQSFPTGTVRKKFTPNKTPTQLGAKKTTVTPKPAKTVEKPAEPSVPLKKFTFEDLESKEKIVKAILKYNEEFLMISQCEEDIWKTSNIWNFVAREITGQTDTETLFGIKLAFKEMLKKYILLLDKDVVMSAADVKKLCPFFDFFHKKLDLRPFQENIEKLKDGNISCDAHDTVTSSDDKDVEMLPTPERSEKETPVATPVKKTVEKYDEIKFDEKQDMFLLMAVSNFLSEFSNESVLENEVWSKVAKEVNESADEAEQMKYKTRFYGLLQQYKQLCEKNTAPISSNEKTLKFLFSKMDTTPFEKAQSKQQVIEADEDCLVVAEANDSSNKDISKTDSAENESESVATEISA